MSCRSCCCAPCGDAAARRGTPKPNRVALRCTRCPRAACVASVAVLPSAAIVGLEVGLLEALSCLANGPEVKEAQIKAQLGMFFFNLGRPGVQTAAMKARGCSRSSHYYRRRREGNSVITNVAGAAAPSHPNVDPPLRGFEPRWPRSGATNMRLRRVGGWSMGPFCKKRLPASTLPAPRNAFPGAGVLPAPRPHLKMWIRSLLKRFL
jgi:hypothetical protein